MRDDPPYPRSDPDAVRPGGRYPAVIGVYICHCGINIAGRVDVEALAAYVGAKSGVAVSRHYKFMCSDPGQKLIEEDIRRLGLTRVVVASCSPRIHEKTFQGACRRAGLNPYLFQMASIREQVSWVTEDPSRALWKAKGLVTAALNRARFHESLPARSVPVNPDILVVGGGIAGMQAALDIGNSGRKAYLVERSATLGGHMLQFDKTFPTLDCAACIGTPKMVEVAQNPNIELLSYSDVTHVEGFVGNYTVRVRRKPRYVRDNCTGCGECAAACPVSVPSEWDEKLAQRKAIYRAFPQAVPITFCIDKKDRAPCTGACPAGVNIQGYVQLIGAGKYTQALKLILEKVPLPGVLGRICPHPCETACRRGQVDEPVSICALKRFVADTVDIDKLPVPEIEKKEEKVAIIGSGPAGLSAAHFLALEGYRVSVFESLSVAGGMLRVGIPDYRLPPEVLDREIRAITRLGVEIKYNTALGRDITLAKLLEEGFKAVYLAIGAHQSLRLNIPAEDAEGVMHGVDFLRRVNLCEFGDLNGKRVVIVGGGDVAIDAARCALRNGAGKVNIFYRRTRKEMPARENEIEDALAEGIGIRYLTAPQQILTRDNKVIGIQCIRMELGEPDSSGRRRPIPVPGSEFTEEADIIIPAIGQTPESSFLAESEDLKISRWGTIEVDDVTYQTSREGVFAGGDAQSGPWVAIGAVAAGREAAISISRYLKGEDLAAGRKKLQLPQENFAPIPKDIQKKPREHQGRISMARGKSGFDEVEQGLTEAQARAEASKCLNCGLCSECMECVRVCEAKAVDHSMQASERDIRVGSIILATGYDVMDPSALIRYGHGRYPNVFTSLEFERLCNATGPTGGKILLRDGNGGFGRPPRSVALVHCVGSRDVSYHEYCSRVCCMYALKYSHLLKEKVGHATRVYDFYIDLRCFGKGYEEFLNRCRKEGTVFIRGKVAEIRRARSSAPDGEDLLVIAEDTLLGERVEIPVEMAVLCMAMEARGDAVDVGRIFGVSTGADGFFLEQHPKLAPLDTASDGVFLAGTCQAPKDIPDTVSQASGAAAKALSLSVRGEVEIPSAVSWIDPDICAGCRVCIDLCAYGAISFDRRKGISRVNEAVCKGCGSCAGFCPSGAARVRHFRDEQVFAEIDGIMDVFRHAAMP